MHLKKLRKIASLFICCFVLAFSLIPIAYALPELAQSTSSATSTFPAPAQDATPAPRTVPPFANNPGQAIINRDNYHSIYRYAPKAPPIPTTQPTSSTNQTENSSKSFDRNKASNMVIDIIGTITTIMAGLLVLTALLCFCMD